MNALKQIFFLGLILIGFTALLISCSADQQKVDSILDVKPKETNANSTVNDFTATEFIKNKDLWNRQNISSYEMVVEAQNSSNIARQVTIKVENRRAKSIVKNDAADKGSSESYKRFDTVEKIFEIVERESKMRHDVFKVNYDSNLGYPLQVISDENLKTADEEFSIRILSLKTE
jgi:Family of unknown function (DUF6174)